MRSHCPILLLTLLLAGCASSPQRAARREDKALDENTRLSEQRRMLAVERGDVASKRGAEILVFDPNKTYDPSRSSVGGHTYDTRQARVKEFYFNQKTNPRSFQTQDFYGVKPAAAAQRKFATREANTRGTYEIPNANKAVNTKTAPTKEVWDAGRMADTRNLRDGKREFLGPESKKVHRKIDPATLSDWRSAGESVANSGTSVEKYTTLKQLSIDDIRELLNKNK